ncbi:MAG: hypothetical protein DI535_01965 [Citrobacter freundii]|nr:MAG: hypothetical protein DI535_01965 [Citrobacter freundii]
MKNLTLLRLAGIGLFGVTFVSPGSIEKKDWISDELSSVQIFRDLPFTLSAFCQETNYPKRSDRPAVAIIPLSEIEVSSIDATVFQSPVSAVIPEKQEKLPTGWKPAFKKPSQAKRPITITYQNQIDNRSNSNELVATTSEETRPEDSILIYSHATPVMENDEENLLPPTEYVDEIKRAPSYSRLRSIIPIINRSAEVGLSYYPHQLLANRIERLSQLSARFGYSTKYAFLINLGLKSGKKRFLVLDLESKSVIASGLVAHGRGKEKFTLNKKYSNRYGSSCSSLGLYKVGCCYKGDFGKSFRLIGLEKTNNNALNRAIVLHSMGCIPDEEIDYPICQSEGCPSVSPGFLETISKIIKSTDKPVLLWAFDPTVDEDLSP